MSDEHLNEMVRQCQNVTALGRLANHEAVAVVQWLLDNGHMTRTGKPLEQPRQAPRVIARKSDGSPIYAADADHSPTVTVTVGAR